MYKLTITVTEAEWRDRGRWHEILTKVRQQLHETPQRVISIRLERKNGQELWRGINHCRR